MSVDSRALMPRNQIVKHLNSRKHLNNKLLLVWYSDVRYSDGGLVFKWHWILDHLAIRQHFTIWLVQYSDPYCLILTCCITGYSSARFFNQMVYCSFFVGLLQLLLHLDRKSPSPTRPFPKNRITQNEVAAKTIPKIILPKVRNGDTGQAKLNPTKIILRKKFEKVRKMLKRKKKRKFLRKNEKLISEKVISKMKASQKRLAAVVNSELVK